MAYTPAAEQSVSVPRQQQRYSDEPASTGWTGWVAFGGFMMVLSGFFGLIEGLVALAKDQYFLVTKNGLLVATSYTAWGWTHLAVGAVVLVAGVGVLTGQLWARIVGIALAFVSAIVNIAFLSAYPVWSTMIVAIDVVVIYALVVHGAEMKNR
ncbi:MAG TPA: hypothetical protein VLR26_11495 [Frankiaceae bacterium]|nr:hypothetical protein [Frankiaceae bacterium]